MPHERPSRRPAVASSENLPQRLNDTCYSEQKSYNIIRQAVGYFRYDSEQEVALIAQMYESLRLISCRSEFAHCCPVEVNRSACISWVAG